MEDPTGQALWRTPQGKPYGGGRDRTDDPLLAKQVLSQLSYTPKTRITRQTTRAKTATAWWAREDSNLRPHAYQACALTS